MDIQAYLDSLEDLTGKTAVVTGGTQGIGLQTTLLLARKGARVYVCALDGPKDKAGFSFALEEIKTYPSSSTGIIFFQPLDLSSISETRKSAQELRSRLSGRLDILICNAATAFPTLSELSADGYERTFAVNCLGHFTFISSLLDVIERSAQLHGEARITMTASQGYMAAHKFDYAALTTVVPKDGTSLLHLGAGFQRYLDSKLGVLFIALELDRRLREKGVKNVRVNACHPGQTPKTGLGSDQQPLVGPRMDSAIRNSLGFFMRQSTQDSAKTQVFLSASKLTRETDMHGEYWAPKWSWRQKFTGCQREKLKTALSRDLEERKRLWEFCEGALAKA